MKKKRKQISENITCPIELVLNRIIDYVIDDDDISLHKVEDVIYNDFIIIDAEDTDILITQGRKRELVNQFVVNLNSTRVSKVVLWLFKPRINSLFDGTSKKERTPVDPYFINIVKELLWVSYYFHIKPSGRLRIIGSPMDILSRLQGVYLDGNSLASRFNSNREEYIANILSLKNSKVEFLPYPDHIDPDDLEILLIANNAMTDELFCVVRSLYQFPFTPYERYHVFDFIKTIVKEKIKE